jgi:ELWxxDGT repeat protein
MRQANGPPLLQRDDGVHGRELWRSDGTAVGTGRVFAINTTLEPQGSYPCSRCSVPQRFGGRPISPAGTSTAGYELWSTNGTQAGTQLLKHINRGVINSVPQQFATVGSKLLSPAARRAAWSSGRATAPRTPPSSLRTPTPARPGRTPERACGGRRVGVLRRRQRHAGHGALA